MIDLVAVDHDAVDGLWRPRAFHLQAECVRSAAGCRIGDVVNMVVTQLYSTACAGHIQPDGNVHARGTHVIAQFEPTHRHVATVTQGNKPPLVARYAEFVSVDGGRFARLGAQYDLSF